MAATSSSWRDTRIELVSKDQEIIFYILEDDGKSPTPTKGFSGRGGDPGQRYKNVSP